MNRAIKSRIWWIYSGLLLLVGILSTWLFLHPRPDSSMIDDETDAAADDILALQGAFPPLNAPDPDAVELGRQLFFDPILSGNNSVSCATCHHPDHGFSDGLAVPLAPDGTPLRRNSPTIWNSGYAGVLFHDGRADSLEAQARESLLQSSEMNADPAETEAELAALPEYVALFDAAFGVDSISFENVLTALAAFERTLTANNTPFDRYATGDSSALTPAQQRGLSLFLSAETSCFECHTVPTFASDTFRVIGVPSDDPGRLAIFERAPPGSFRVPTLRNVALSGPYMHNGSIKTLSEVVQFYADGGGRQFGDNNPSMDMFVEGFALSDREKSDLVAFLHALTDESNLPEVPPVALSGLPTVERLQSSARAAAAAINVAH